MKHSLLFLIVFFNILNGLAQNNMEANPVLQTQDFVAWAKKNHIAFNLKDEASLKPFLAELGQSIGNARVVAISEALHGCEEMLLLEKIVVKYLVQEKGFNLVMAESALPESKYVNDYIHGAKPIPDLYGKGLGYLYALWGEGRSLIEWLREYNQLHENKIDYIGADIAGFYKNWQTPTQVIFDYLQKVDPEYTKSITQTFKPILVDLGDNAAENYIKFSIEKKANVNIWIDHLLNNMLAKEQAYVAASSQKEYAFQLQAVKSLVLAENYYKNMADNRNKNINRYVGLNGREIALGQNVLWALNQYKDSKIIFICHNYHTRTESFYQNKTYGFFVPAGAFIKQSLQKDYFAIGLFFGQGTQWKTWRNPGGETTAYQINQNKINGTLSHVFEGNFLSLWRKAEPKAQPWTNSLQEAQGMRFRPIEWDAGIYLHQITPAVLAEKNN